MKKNLLTIIILALGILNIILTAVIVFAVVPTTMRTNNLIAKVASSIELELETPTTEEAAKEIDIADIENYYIEDEIIINLVNSGKDSKNHFAKVEVSLSINTKSKDYKSLQPKIADNEGAIKEIIRDEFSKYTELNITENKDAIKADILTRIQEYFNSDFIINISVGNLIVE